MNSTYQVLDLLWRLSDALVLLTCAICWGYWVEMVVIRSKRPFMRLCAVLLIILWSASAVFHLLAAYRSFTLLWANIAWGLLAAFALASSRFRPYALVFLKRDFLWLRKTIRRNQSPVYLSLVALNAVLILLIVARSLWLPPLTWDAITYHAVKSALWVQQGHLAMFPSPGAWGGYYRMLFGGGEVFFAWAMLPFHSDFMVGVFDAMLWVALLLPCYAVARHLGIRPAPSWAIAVFCVSSPAICTLAGALYTDNLVILFLLLAFVFFAHFQRTRGGGSFALCFAALGMVVSIKATAWPIVVFMMAWICFNSLRSTYRHPSLATSWLASGGVFLIPFIVWLIQNWGESGYPLGIIPLRIGRMVLGEASDATRLMQHALDTELASKSGYVSFTMHQVFHAPWLPGIHASWISLPLMLAGLWALVRKHPPRLNLGVRLLGGMALVAGAPFILLREFQRLVVGWGTSFARFLMPAFLPLVLLGGTILFPRQGTRRSRTRFLSAGLWAASAVHLGARVFFGWSVYDFAGLALLIAVGAGIILIVILGCRVGRGFLLKGLVILATLTLLAWPIGRFREKHRYKLLAQSVQLHDMPRDISLCARALDKPARSFNIAVTAGAWPTLDNWMLYYFLGSRLQNKLLYVPITRDGSIVDFPVLCRDDPRMDPQKWLNRLRKQHIDAVMAFWPEPIEVRWMGDNPALFERLAGRYPRWGLYWLRPTPDTTFWLTY